MEESVGGRGGLVGRSRHDLVSLHQNTDFFMIFCVLGFSVTCVSETYPVHRNVARYRRGADRPGNLKDCSGLSSGTIGDCGIGLLFDCWCCRLHSWEFGAMRLPMVTPTWRLPQWSGALSARKEKILKSGPPPNPVISPLVASFQGTRSKRGLT